MEVHSITRRAADTHRVAERDLLKKPWPMSSRWTQLAPETNEAHVQEPGLLAALRGLAFGIHYLETSQQHVKPEPQTPTHPPSLQPPVTKLLNCLQECTQADIQASFGNLCLGSTTSSDSNASIPPLASPPPSLAHAASKQGQSTSTSTSSQANVYKARQSTLNGMQHIELIQMVQDFAVLPLALLGRTWLDNQKELYGSRIVRTWPREYKREWSRVDGSSPWTRICISMASVRAYRLNVDAWLKRVRLLLSEVFTLVAVQHLLVETGVGSLVIHLAYTRGSGITEKNVELSYLQDNQPIDLRDKTIPESAKSRIGHRTSFVYTDRKAFIKLALRNALQEALPDTQITSAEVLNASPEAGSVPTLLLRPHVHTRKSEQMRRKGATKQIDISERWFSSVLVRPDTRPETVMSTNALTLATLTDISVARQSLVSSTRQIVTQSSSVDECWFDLLARWMTMSGIVTTINPNGVQRQTNFYHASTYQKSADFLIQASRSSETALIATSSAALTAGGSVQTGSHYARVMSKPREQLAAMRNTQLQEAMQAAPIQLQPDQLPVHALSANVRAWQEFALRAPMQENQRRAAIWCLAMHVMLS